MDSLRIKCNAVGKTYVECSVPPKRRKEIAAALAATLTVTVDWHEFAGCLLKSGLDSTEAEEIVRSVSVLNEISFRCKDLSQEDSDEQQG